MLVELRLAQIVICLLASVGWLLLALRHRQYWGYTVAPIWFLVNIVVFNVARIYGIPADRDMSTLWSIAIRIMGILAAGILGFGLFFDLRNNGYNGHVK